VCRPKHVEQLRNIGIINSTTRLHLVGYFYEINIQEILFNMKSCRLTNAYKHDHVYLYLGYLPTAIIGSHKMKHRSSSLRPRSSCYVCRENKVHQTFNSSCSTTTDLTISPPNYLFRPVLVYFEL
jgi:hypothetical protein